MGSGGLVLLERQGRLCSDRFPLKEYPFQRFTLPEHAVFGGIPTARRAGMTTVGVFDPFYANRQDELKSVSTQYVQSLEELLER